MGPLGFDFSRAQWSSGQLENRIIKRLVRMAGVKRSVQVVRRQGEKLEAESLPLFRVVSTHTARRTFARAWYDRGGDLNKLREHLGHADLATTLRYVGVEKDETNREAARLFG